MQILFDNIIYSKEKQGGISNYWHHITRPFAQLEGAFFYEEKNATDNIFRHPMQLRNIVLHSQKPLLAARLLPVSFAAQNERLLYHSSFYRKVETNASVSEVTTVHDFLHNHHAALLNRTMHNLLKYAAIRRSQGVICVSNSTYADLKKYCPTTTRQKVAVIYNGVSDAYHPIKDDQAPATAWLNDHLITQRYLLYVGARTAYKNFSFVVQLLTQLPTYRLVVVGNPFTAAERATISRKTMERITVVSGISDQQLNVLYNYAHALVYPSSYEGFGIPVAEAMKAGCPVLALNTSSIPEIADGAARLFDRPDPYTFVQEIAHLENADYRAEIIDKGLKNAIRFSWNKCASETVAFYKEVYGSPV